MTEVSFLNKIYAEKSEKQDVNEISLYLKEENGKTVEHEIKNLKFIEKTYSNAKHEITELIIRITSFDSLVIDWLEEQSLPKNVLVYLLENIVPILVLGLQKLLIEAEKFDFKENKEFNPINFLAQYLMRNKLHFKKNAETSPYGKSIQKILSKFNKKNVHKFEAEKEKGFTKSIEEIFIQWTGQRNALIKLSLVNSLQCSFQEHLLNKSQNKDYVLNIKDCGTTNSDERLLNIKEFVQYLNDQWCEVDEEVFNEFKNYSLSCCLSYATLISFEDTRNALNDLFIFCVKDQVRYLNRTKVLNLLANFYDQSDATMKQFLQNPRIWPIIEFEEEDSNEINDYLCKDISEADAIIDTKLAKQHVGVFNKFQLSKDQFVNMLLLFLADSSRFMIESLIKFIQVKYIQTNEEVAQIKEKKDILYTQTADIEITQNVKNIEKRYMLLNYLFDLWDRDSSGFLEINEIENVLINWRKDEIHDYLYSQTFGAFDNIFWKISRSDFKQIIDEICALFPNKDVFDQLIRYLIKSVQRLSEEDNNDGFARKMLQTITFSGKTSSMMVDPLFQQTIQVVQQYAKNYGKMKISVYVAMFENKMFENIHSFHTLDKKYNTEETNDVAAKKSVHVAPNVFASAENNNKKYLRYVATCAHDRDILLNRVLHRGLKCVSFDAVDTGKPIYIQEVLNHGGVFLWNPIRALEKYEGSFICFPLKDKEQNVIGILGIDTMAEPNETKFFLKEISFYQVVAKVLSQTYQELHMVQRKIQIAENAVFWILKSCSCVNKVVIYHVEPDLEPSKSNSLHKLMKFDKNHCLKTYDSSRVQRNSNIFKNHLFQCIDVSMTVITKELKEYHYVFPIRDVYGAVILILDINICSLDFTMQEKMEIKRLLKLLNMAQKEMKIEEFKVFPNYFIFDQILLENAKNNILQFSDRMLEEFLSYQQPPKIIHSILKAVCCIYFEEKGDTYEFEKLDQWDYCRDFLSSNLVEWIILFDPVNQVIKGEENKFVTCLKDLSAEHYLMAPMVPSRYLINWAFVCLNLMEKIKIKILQYQNASSEIITN
ncbi:EF-hand calcium-binding domain-containing protein 5 isoform X3 [Hydra vulgaris]|uniref:EF-hand calcium-binding domain-containing protein 5 isoform X3 n=1 Tax=Hydra vulgaris TaxID=6087 RepID=A0ABM4BXQ6_HYDVU